jgi:hypothetical protein
VSRGGWRPWKNAGGRDRQPDVAPEAEVQWSESRFPGEPVRIWPSSADGRWRDKVILSESFADLNAEPGEPEIELAD